MEIKIPPYTSILDVINNLNSILPVAIDNLYLEKDMNLDLNLSDDILDLVKAQRLLLRINLCRSNISHMTRVGPSNTVYMHPKYYDLLGRYEDHFRGGSPDILGENLFLPTFQIGDHILVARIWDPEELEHYKNFNKQFPTINPVFPNDIIDAGVRFEKQFSAFKVLNYSPDGYEN